MKIAHWTIGNGSGMYRVAESICEAEKQIGCDSVLINLDKPETFSAADDADIHVAHTHLSAKALHDKKSKIVWVGHGTPEVSFHGAYEAGIGDRYGHGDGWMLAQFWLQHADAIVTFWPRHQKIWKSLCDKRTEVNLIPLGVDKTFWSPQTSNGKFAGEPSILTAENSYEIKWPLDLFIAWPWVTKDESLHEARLHAIYLPRDQHRWWFPLVNRNGCSFSSYISPIAFDHNSLRNAFCSTDYYLGLVRYGDFNRICLEAKATGSKVISYRGNPYADFWITEGDQRIIAEELTKILRGEVEPRDTNPVGDIADTAKAMKEIYEKIA